MYEVHYQLSRDVQVRQSADMHYVISVDVQMSCYVLTEGT